MYYYLDQGTPRGTNLRLDHDEQGLTTSSTIVLAARRDPEANAGLFHEAGCSI